MSQQTAAPHSTSDYDAEGIKYKYFTALSRAADGVIVDIFNDCYASLYSSVPARRNFCLNTADITKHRRVVSRWTPQKYGPDLGMHGFDVPLALSAYFDRYISFPETFQAKSLEAKAAVKLLNVNKDGWKIDSYVLNHPDLERLITKMRYHIGCLFSKPLNVGELYSKTGHGPNSTTDVEFSNAYLHVKDLQFVGTRPALQQYIHYLHWDHKARELMIRENDSARAAINGVDMDLSEFVCDVAKVSLVPKSYKDLRTMRPEGTVNSWFCQMIAKHLTDILKVNCNICLGSQPEVHRALAKLGSLDPELFIATIDWSEASDRIWTSLVQNIFTEGHAPQWYNFMHEVCRVGKSSMVFTVDAEQFKEILPLLDSECDSWTAVKLDKREGTHFEVSCVFQCSMFANMGNPITFPLQTLIFWAFLTSCGEIYCEDTGEIYDALQWPSCFGDDGIIDSRIFSVVQHYAPMLGWKLNAGKSFVEGGFRESCGGDYYYGRYVRPFCSKRPPLDPRYTENRNKKVFQAWLYVLANNMADLLRRVGCSTTPIERRLEVIHAELELGSICVVPPCYSDGSGYRVYGSLYNPRFDVSFVGPLLRSALNREHVMPDFVYNEGWHAPFWRTDLQAWSFKALSNKPDEYSLDEFYHEHYLNRWLKIGNPDPHDAAYVKTSFFEPHKGVELLSKDGQLRVKEFKPNKATQLATTWC